MSLPPARRLASFVEPAIDERRIARVWDRVARKGAPRSWAWVGSSLVPSMAVGAVVFLVMSHRTPAAAPVSETSFEAGGTPTLSFADGSRATLGENARLRENVLRADRYEATVERGRVAFDVRHDASRVFVVHAGSVDLIDRGTRFSVDVEGTTVSVSVEEGRVEMVRPGTREVTLAAGEAWSSNPAPAVPSLATSALVPEPTASAEPAPSTREEPPIRPALPEPRATPAELLQAANDARLAGRPRDAAIAFDTLRRRFRSDPRAGLAAFELGRLRLDSLGDVSGAAEALTDATVLAPSGAFREDADARLVQAYEAMHDVRRCSSARRAYLERYPNGLHAAAVAARCP